MNTTTSQSTAFPAMAAVLASHGAHVHPAGVYDPGALAHSINDPGYANGFTMPGDGGPDAVRIMSLPGNAAFLHTHSDNGASIDTDRAASNDCTTGECMTDAECIARLEELRKGWNDAIDAMLDATVPGWRTEREGQQHDATRTAEKEGAKGRVMSVHSFASNLLAETWLAEANDKEDAEAKAANPAQAEPAAKPALILSAAQAQAIYSPLCALNDIGGEVDARMPDGIRCTTSKAPSSCATASARLSGTMSSPPPRPGRLSSTRLNRGPISSA